MRAMQGWECMHNLQTAANINAMQYGAQHAQKGILLAINNLAMMTKVCTPEWTCSFLCALEK